MKWFKHDVDMSSDLKIQVLIEKHGIEGYGIYNLCLEMVGKEGKRGKIGSDLRWFEGLLKIAQWSDKDKFKSILETMVELRLICPKSFKYGNLFIPKFVRRADDYTRRQIRTESVGSPEKVALEKKREEENKNKNKRLLTLFKSLHKDLTGEDYLPSYGKDQKILYELLGVYDEDTVNQLINEFFKSGKNPAEWWADKLSIGVFKSVIPQLIGKLRKK